MPIFGNGKRLETLAGPQCREYLAIFDDNLADSFSGMVKKSSFTTEQDSYIWSEVNYIPFNAIWEVSMALSLFFSIITQFAMALLIVMMPLIDGSPIEKYLPWPVVLAPLVTAMLSPFKKTSITIFITFISIRISDYNFSKPFFEDDFMIFMLSASFILLAIFIFSTIMSRFLKPKERMNTIFNRKTGKVHIYCKKEKERKAVPFSDLAPSKKSWSTPMHHSIDPGQTLTVVHKETGLRACKIIVNNGNYYDPYLRWEIFQQFMNPSLPLPDVPEFEPIRQYDPVTKKHDQETSRPENFFRDMGRAESILRCQKAKEAAYDYPWGRPLEQAKAMGWQPSIKRISPQEIIEVREKEKDTFQNLTSEITHAKFFKRSLPFLLFCILLMLIEP